MFYVYVKKAPVREFTDDYIRDYLSNMNSQEAWDSILPLTKLGQKLGELNVQIDIEEDIPFLGIKSGTYDLQRLFLLYKICKAYYREDYSLEEMNHLNFDWFMPTNCFRHTREVKVFCKKADLYIEKMRVEESGISVIAKNFN